MPELNDSGVLSYSVRTLFNEETTVEREIIEHLKAAKLGWTWRLRDFLKVYRPDESEVLLLPLLREKLKALNPAVLTNDARVDAIITKLRGCRDNQQWRCPCGGPRHDAAQEEITFLIDPAGFIRKPCSG